MPDGRDRDRPSGSGVSGKLFVSLVVAAAAAAAILANVLLLGSAAANNDPVGRLSPRAHLPVGRLSPRTHLPVGRLSPRTHLPAAPHWTVRPTTGRPHDEHADD